MIRMRTVIAVITHKKYVMPEDPLYLPVAAGAALAREDGFRPMIVTADGSCMDGSNMTDLAYGRYIRDDTGDNISERNRTFCELTGLYRIWKDDELLKNADSLGLCHYRRYFASPARYRLQGRLRRTSGAFRPEDAFAYILTAEEADRLMADTDIILPVRRRYFIETNRSHYVHAHHAAELDLAEEIIRERCPEYLEAFNSSMKKRSGHRFNMFIMKKDLFRDYCSWLFGILFEMERRLDMTGYSDREKRVFGYVAERLLDVWIDAGGYEYKELPYIMTERENLPAKALHMIIRKIRGKAK